MFKKITEKVTGLAKRNRLAVTGAVTEVVKDESGQGMAEYGLIIALVAVVIIVALRMMGVKITDIFNKVNDALT